MKVFEKILVDVHGSVAFVTLNRPEKRNAINVTMMRELRAAIDRAESEDVIKILVLRAAGDKSFSSGIDLDPGIMDDPSEMKDLMIKEFLPLMESMQRCSKLMIASVEGAAVGMGCSLAMHCDLLVMSEDASLDLVFSKLGLVADGGINWLLPKKVGYGKALQMVLEAEKLDAMTCLALGIANKVFTRSTIGMEVASWAQALSERATLPQGLTKQLMRAAICGDSLLDTLYQEAEAQAVCAGSEYFQHAYARFLGR